MFSVRLLDGNPAQAAAFVQYSKDMNYNIEYWSIGNEPTLYNAVMETRGETYDIERFNKEWRTFAEAMKAVDPTIKLVGPEINQFSYSTEPGATTNFGPRDEEWLVEFLKANGDMVDVVSFHRYPFPKTRTSGPPTLDELRANTQEWDKIIIHARELIHEHTGRDIPIAVTEFNSMYGTPVGGETTPDSHFNAIWMADVLGRMIKNGVFMANEWALATKGGQGGSGLVTQFETLPAYYTHQMYNKFGTELVYSSSDDPTVTVYAARREDGSLTVMLINLSSEEQTKPIRIGDQAEFQADTWLFDPQHKAENTGMTAISGSITLPAQSLTLLVIR
jgi:alpha-L-arabinofuranosidase